MNRFRNINRQILKLAIPSIIAGITIPLVGMADTAIAGRLGSSVHIGAIAVGSMLFDWLYWNMGFLRMGTAGFTAQAYGRGNKQEAVKIFLQGMIMALGAALFVILIQVPYAELFFWIMPTSPETEQFAKEYFFIRVWAAPAALSLFTIRGWFIGMQNTIGPMVIEFVVNLTNIFLSYYLAIRCDMGVAGIAWGTVIAQYTGLLCGGILLWIFFGKYRSLLVWKDAFIWKDLKRFFTVNANLFVRSICMLFVYCGFTMLATRYGDTLLAVSSIMMKLLLLYSYFIDGFAYAGEAMVGRFIGAKNNTDLRLTIKLLFMWCGIIGVASTVFYVCCDEWLLHLMTSVKEVLDATLPYLPWLYTMPFVSCIAFTWDGIFIGATASVALRNTMIYSVISFYLCFFILDPFIGIQSLWVGYAMHLVVRSVLMTCFAKKHVYNRVSALA